MDQATEDKFVKQIFEDKALQEKLSGCKSSSEALEVVKAEGYDVGLKEFETSMNELNDFLKQASRSSGNEELSDNDLEMVAGGRRRRRGGSRVFGSIFRGIGQSSFKALTAPGRAASSAAA